MADNRSFTLRHAQQRLAEIEADRADPVAAGWLSESHWREALRHAVIDEYEARRIDDAYDRRREMAMEDMTGQDLDEFYGD